MCAVCMRFPRYVHIFVVLVFVYVCIDDENALGMFLLSMPMLTRRPLTFSDLNVFGFYFVYEYDRQQSSYCLKKKPNRRQNGTAVYLKLCYTITAHD